MLRNMVLTFPPLPPFPPPRFLIRCVAAEIERIGLIESGELDEDEAHHDPVPAITKVKPGRPFVNACYSGLLASPNPYCLYYTPGIQCVRGFSLFSGITEAAVNSLPPPPTLCFLVFFYAQAHFEESMAHSRKSVSEEELARYESFSTNMKSDRGFEEFSFDDKEGGANDADADADDVDDLYG